VLSEEIYKQSVRDILGSRSPDQRVADNGISNIAPTERDERQVQQRRALAGKWALMEERLRFELSARNQEALMQMSRDFAPLALGLKKIWTFVENWDTDLRVLSGGKGGEELEDVYLRVLYLQCLW
jgi:hypothetical protein